MILLGLDLGSAKTGLCAIDPEARDVIGAATVPVDPKNLRATVDAIGKAIEASGAERVIVEWNERPYMPADASAAAAMAYARETMARLLERVEQLAETWHSCGVCGAKGRAPCAEGCVGGEGRRIPCERIAVMTWRSRVGALKRSRRGVTGFRGASWARLNPRRETADRRVKEALRRELGEAAEVLRDVHQKDACGAALGWARAPAEPKARAPRVRIAKAGDATKTRQRAPASSKIDALCDAIRAHGRPIRLDVLAVRLAMFPGDCAAVAKKALTCGRVRKVAHGVYALAEVT